MQKAWRTSQAFYKPWTWSRPAKGRVAQQRIYTGARGSARATFSPLIPGRGSGSPPSGSGPGRPGGRRGRAARRRRRSGCRTGTRRPGEPRRGGPRHAPADPPIAGTRRRGRSEDLGVLMPMHDDRHDREAHRLQGLRHVPGRLVRVRGGPGAEHRDAPDALQQRADVRGRRQDAVLPLREHGPRTRQRRRTRRSVSARRPCPDTRCRAPCRR
jgi:hypothetical protein